MQTPLINIILLGLTSLSAFIVIAYWWATTKGTWAKVPAGRSLMGLLAIIAIGFGYGTINVLIGRVGYPAKPYIGLALYALFIGSIIVIGFTIRKEMMIGRAKAAHPATKPAAMAPAAPVLAIDITVGTTPTEKAENHD